MTILFEYGEWVSIEHENALKKMLIDVWHQDEANSEELIADEEIKDTRYQPFLKFDGKQVRANNYVGFIQNGDEIIEIYPKVFRDNPDAQKDLILRHVFYWLDYCRKWKFPFTRLSLDTKDIKSFPELIINLIANQFLDTVSYHPLTMYQSVEETCQVPKGTINFKRYVSNGLGTGNYHQIECDYEPFLFDNKVNRIIKYCSRLLLDQSRIYENQRLLQEIIFILDEVEDQPCSNHDVEGVRFNPFYTDYSGLMTSCSLILKQQLYSHSTYDLSQWCILFPMEYIFEDFLAGFLQKHFTHEWKIEYQKSDKYLAQDRSGRNVFNMQHDIFLTNRKDPQTKVIVDTKYKLRDQDFKNDPKKGIAQADLYQMTSYAFRRGCNNVLLIYPNRSEKINDPDIFQINSGYPSHENINMMAIEIPFWSITDFESLPSKMNTWFSQVLTKYYQNESKNLQL